MSGSLVILFSWNVDSCICNLYTVCEKKKNLQKWSGTNVDEGWWPTRAFKNLQTPNVTNHDIAPVKYHLKPLLVWLPDIFYACPEHPLECWHYKCAVLEITKYSGTNLQSAGSQHYLDLIMCLSFHRQSQRLCFFLFKKIKNKNNLLTTPVFTLLPAQHSMQNEDLQVLASSSCLYNKNLASKHCYTTLSSTP